MMQYADIPPLRRESGGEVGGDPLRIRSETVSSHLTRPASPATLSPAFAAERG
jgi:hypothetical protein